MNNAGILNFLPFTAFDYLSFRIFGIYLEIV